MRELELELPEISEVSATSEVHHDLGKRRSVTARVVTAMACLLVLFALIAPNEIARFTPAAFVRIPVEGLLAVALLLVLPARSRPVTATILGAAVGLLTIGKLADFGFFTVLDRPFDPISDWTFLQAATVFLTESTSRAVTIVAVVAAALLAGALIIFMALAARRLTRLMEPHRTSTARTVAVLGVVWVVCAVVGVQVVADTSVAAHDYVDRALQVRASLKDREVFAAEAAVDAFRDTPGEQLLTGLRGKDVAVAFVESYGRVAVEDPQLAPQLDAVLQDGDRRLREAGFASRSGFLTSPTAGGGSWLAHATLLSGLWIDTQQRYRTLLASDRLTLNGAFRRADWRAVSVMPGVTRPWPEGAFFDCDKIYGARDLGYRGPRYSFATMPDQYTLSFFQRTERAAMDRRPVMAEISLVSSHAPWAPIPQLVDWNQVGDGSVFTPPTSSGGLPEVTLQRDRTEVRADYGRAIEYSLNTLISYVETYGDDDLVLVFLGDHQPSPVVTGDGASRDVPITIVARDQAVLDSISGWGWHEGLKPGPSAPVWRMDVFRDRFLTAFGGN